MHPNEGMLRQAYARFARGDMDGFLAHCTDDVTFDVPGTSPGSRVYTKGDFMELVRFVVEVSGGTFREEIVEAVANDARGVLLLDHTFQRDGRPVAYRTCHVMVLRDGRIAAWREWPGDMDVFNAAWS